MPMAAGAGTVTLQPSHPSRVLGRHQEITMSHALLRLGRYAARHPAKVIGAWLALTVV